MTVRRQRTRRTLIEAAMEVFAQTGVAAASIEEICEAAGFTRGAFYSNFDSKDDLLLEVIEQETQIALEYVNAAVDTGGAVEHQQDVCAAGADLHETLETAISHFYTQNLRSPAWIISHQEIYLYTLRHPELRERYLELQNTFKHQLHELLDNALTTWGRTPKIPVAELIDVLTAYYMQSAAEAAVRNPHQAVLDLDPAPLVRIVEAVLEG